MLPTVVMTFDTDLTTYTNALWAMTPAPETGLPCIPGTFFADAYRIGTAGWPTKDHLTIMAMNNWEIGARVYGINGGGQEINMVAALAANRTTAFARLKEQRDIMHAIGFDIKSISAAQRAWSPQLRGLAAHLFENVRVCDHTNYGTLPVADRLYIRDGGSDSWSASDTEASLCAWVDGLVAAGPGAVGIPIIHRIDTAGDPLYTTSPTVFQGVISHMQTKITAGVLRAATLRDVCN